MDEYDRDAPLFDRRFHVLVQYPDRDEALLVLTIRLLTGTRVRVSIRSRSFALRRFRLVARFTNRFF